MDPAHSHRYDSGNLAAERNTRVVMWITLLMMGFEIVAGGVYRSMALLADGWHMGSHALAIGLSAFAYTAARRLAADPRFAFGTWKIEILAGYTSAVFLLGVAGLMIVASVERLFFPAAIHYREAIIVAAVGLVVNVVCALILHRGSAHQHHGHGHGHGHGHDHHHHHHHEHEHEQPHGAHLAPSSTATVRSDDDLNLRAARLHVMADAATSVLAIIALFGGLQLGWTWLDPVMGLAGAALVARWAVGLLRESSQVLLDREMDHPLVHELRMAIQQLPEASATQVTDLHLWRVGRHQFACILRLTTSAQTLTSQAVRAQLAHHPALVHSTVEVMQRDVATATDDGH